LKAYLEIIFYSKYGCWFFIDIDCILIS